VPARLDHNEEGNTDVKIGIIGAGRMGGTLAVLLARAGHQVFPANSRGVESLRDLVAEAGVNAKAVTAEQAAREGELVILALPWGHPEALPAPALVAGKIVVDAMNAYRSNGSPAGQGGATSSEQTAKALPGARLVKAFNTLNFKYMRDAADLTGDDRLSLFVAGDDGEAKRVVGRLMNDMGFAAVDTGSLREGGRSQEPGGPIFNKRLTEAKARAKLAA
jgi:predicted dinucleotide-binding enzyme